MGELRGILGVIAEIDHDVVLREDRRRQHCLHALAAAERIRCAAFATNDARWNIHSHGADIERQSAAGIDVEVVEQLLLDIHRRPAHVDERISRTTRTIRADEREPRVDPIPVDYERGRSDPGRRLSTSDDENWEKEGAEHRVHLPVSAATALGDCADADLDEATT